MTDGTSLVCADSLSRPLVVRVGDDETFVVKCLRCGDVQRLERSDAPPFVPFDRPLISHDTFVALKDAHRRCETPPPGRRQ